MKYLCSALCTVFLSLFIICTTNAAKINNNPAISLLLLQNDAKKYGPQFQNLMTEVMTQYDVPGMAMAIKFPDGSLLQHAAGVADRNSGEALSIKHFFRIGSVSKTITATAILLLCQDGQFSLDDSLDDLLPELPEFSLLGPLYGNGITVRSLLQHLSGLYDYIDGEYDGRDVFDIMRAEPLRHWSPEDLVAIGGQMGVLADAGEIFAYSNTNYILLGLLIEKYGGNYEEFLQERIFKPLGLNNTLSPRTEGLPEPYAHGYFEKDVDGLLHDFSLQHPSGVWSAGNIVSTPIDLLKWLEVLIEGKLLTPSMKIEQFNMQYFSNAGISYGLGVASFGGAVGHNGTVFGYQTWMTKYNGSYIVIYNNCHYLSGDIGHVSQLLFDKIKTLLNIYR